ncbi:hypothetical protein [Rhodococcus kronopolitis]|uniref:Uncharacterized protein n=1 Tax=Rhodococcus kronopolitis TaxID=1460226 RepID=A0ABV9FLW8_9NOCA
MSDALVPRPESFRALARSSPWRWTMLEFELDRSGEVEHAWIRRPDQLRVEDRSGAVLYTTAGVTTTASPVARYSDGGGERVTRVWPTDVEPVYGADGLVLERPGGFGIEYDEPFHEDYFWVALLDPAELAAGVEIREVTAVEHHGRPAWEATVWPTGEYEPRCSCCSLLCGDGEPGTGPWPRTAESVVRLDVQTGVCVSVRHVGGTGAGAGPQRADMRIATVDAPIADELFRRRRWFGHRGGR